jgi:hypothetical protein
MFNVGQISARLMATVCDIFHAFNYIGKYTGIEN